MLVPESPVSLKKRRCDGWAKGVRKRKTKAYEDQVYKMFTYYRQMLLKVS